MRAAGFEHSPASELVRFGRAAGEANLLVSTCGNASVRADAGIAISASGSRLAMLQEADISLIDAQGALVLGPRPSMESDLHRAAYLVRPSIGAVLHCQSRAATVLACMRNPPASMDYIPEIPAYVRRAAYVPYFAPGTTELAEAVARALADPDVTVVQLRNHGQVIVGATWQKALRRAIFFELAAWMHLQGFELNEIPKAEADALRSADRDV